MYCAPFGFPYTAVRERFLIMQSRISIGEIPFQQRPAFAGFTFPSYRRMVAEPKLHPAAICVGMASDRRPAGLALLEWETRETAALVSIWIQPDWRRQGLGARLLGKAEEIAARRGIVEMSSVHMTTLPALDAFEALLRRREWDPPQLRMYALKSNLSLIYQSPWMTKPPVLEPEYTLTPWADTTEDEVLEAGSKATYHPLIWPPNLSNDYDRHSSLAVRRSGELVGWIINHPVNTRMLRFTCSYLRDDLQGRGRMAAVMAASIRRADEAGYTEATWTVPMVFPRMAIFARRHLFPYCFEVAETRASRKALR